MYTDLNFNKCFKIKALITFSLSVFILNKNTYYLQFECFYFKLE